MSTFWKMFLCSLRYCLKCYFSKGCTHLRWALYIYIYIYIFFFFYLRLSKISFKFRFHFSLIIRTYTYLILIFGVVNCIIFLNPLRANLGSVSLIQKGSDPETDIWDIHMDPDQQGEVSILTREHSMPVRLHHSQPRRGPLMTIHSQLPSLGFLNPSV